MLRIVQPGAAAYAGLAKAVQQHLVEPEETIVVLITGNGLKDVRSAIKAAGQAHRIEPTLDQVKELWGKLSAHEA